MDSLLTLLLLLSPVKGQTKQYEIRKPRDVWQKPGEIRQPKGPWRTPGEIQVPKGIQAIEKKEQTCEQRMVIVSDALFAFDQASLSADAEQTLKALAPMLKQKAGKHPVAIEGHTDSVGSDSYNRQLSEKRARAVETWLVSNGYLPAQSAKIQGFGKQRPVAPNTKPDGSDDPEARQKNRRVEVVVNTCN
jgi:outer membrane protein OmpA-like peptidoglycan-associated protein